MDPGVTPALGVFVLLDSIVLAGWALARSALRTDLGLGCLGGLVLLELMVVARAVSELIRLGSAPGGFGQGFAEPAVHLGYVAASVVTLPMLAALTGGAGPRNGVRPADAAARRSERRWDGVIAALGCVTVAVVTVRMASTGRPA
jgi:hypothetical protein